MIKKKHRATRFLVVIAAVIASFIAVIICQTAIEHEMQVQLSDNLKDVAEQNELNIKILLHDKHKMIENVAKEMKIRGVSFETPEDVRAVIKWMNNINDISEFKRMGVIMPDGMAYTTDGFEQPVDSEGYHYGIEGKSHISSMIDTIGEPEQINVFSAPVFADDGETVEAVVFATYRTENLENLISVDSFGGEGYSYIIKEDGTVITDSRKSPMYGWDNVFDSMLDFSSKNESVVERVRKAMEQNLSGYETFYTLNDRSLYYTPIRADATNITWYLWTIVPESVLDAKAGPLLYYQNILFVVLTLVIVALVAYFILTYRKDEKLLRSMAYVDPLTEGDNMSALKETLNERRVSWGYLISVDINDFKLVNNVCGLEKGDETIRGIWSIITDSLKEREVAAHVSADHYVMYLQEVNRDIVLTRIKKISKDIENLANSLGTINIFPYFGIYEIRERKDPEEYCNCANQAKKLVKGNKNKNYAFYEELDLDRIVEEKALVDSFEKAIAKKEFEVWYQPKYKASTSEMVGAEALVRWRKPDGSLVPPYRFIPLFEGNGMILPLDEYIFRMVCEQQKKWESEGKKLYPVSVNISRASLDYSDVVSKYKKIMDECEVDPSMIPLEITESATVNNTQIREVVQQFRDAQFSLHLDDFGSGYSSIATLNMIHFDVLKLDKSLIDFIGDADGERLVTYTIQLAKSMGMSITAEGVETRNQIDFLDERGCDDIQGYYFSKPLPLAEFSALL